MVSPSEFLEIELNDEEAAEALRRAREAKHFKQRKAEYWQEIVKETSYQRPSARELYERLANTQSQLGKPFQLTDWNKKVVFALCLYFAEDPKFETQYPGMSLRKGIYIEGPEGTGKSHLMNAFAINPHISYRNIHCKVVAQQYADPKWQSDGLDALRFYSSSLKSSLSVKEVYGQESVGFCFGDFGTEAVKKQYGNEANVMEYVISQRYENQVPFNQTHFTTNLNADEVVNNYGKRIADRLQEMCNQFVLDGPSWR